MQITELRMKKINTDSKLKAVTSVTFNDCFVVHGIRVIEGNKGLFIAMPSRKLNSGEFLDVAHPIIDDFRQKLEDAVLEEYETMADLEELVEE